MQNIKIISISPYNFFQKNNGVNKRIYYINEFLSKNFLNSIFIIRNEGQIDTNAIKGEIFLGGKTKFSHLLNIKVIKKILSYKNEKIVLFCNTLRGGIYGLVCKKFFNISYIFDDHNVEFLRFKRTKSWKHIIIKLLEKSIIKNAVLTTVCSQNDKEFLIKSFELQNSNIEVLENGVEIDDNKIAKKLDIYQKIRKDLNISENTKIILFFGAFDYKPNIEALNIIENTILPQFNFIKNKDTLFLVIGKGLENYKNKNKNIKYLGFTPNISNYIIASNLIIAPLTSGSGTKLKVIESLGYGKKTITTSIGAEGINQKDKNLIVNDDWTDFIESINKNINLDFESNKNSIYSWNNIENKLINLVNNINK